MLVDHKSEDFEVKVTRHICDYHKRHPEDVAWPGCTCSGTYELINKSKKKGPRK